MELKDYIDLARLIATRSHEGQFRRDGVTPYITHPEAVADMVEDRLKPIAWLHDVIEDSQCKSQVREMIYLLFPPYISSAVHNLTNVFHGLDYDYYISNMVMRDPDAIAVKIADMKHNISCSPSINSIKKIEKWLPILELELKRHEKRT